MPSTDLVPFSNRLRGYLRPAWLNRSTSATRLSRVARSLSTDPVEPVDALYRSYSDSYESSDHLAGFNNVTLHLLAGDVLDTLIQMQSDMSEMAEFEQLLESDARKLSAKASEAYQRAHNNFPEPPPRSFDEAS